jgi:hypothetical protein
MYFIRVGEADLREHWTGRRPAHRRGRHVMSSLPCLRHISPHDSVKYRGLRSDILGNMEGELCWARLQDEFFQTTWAGGEISAA